MGKHLRALKLFLVIIILLVGVGCYEWVWIIWARQFGFMFTVSPFILIGLFFLYVFAYDKANRGK